MAAGNSHNKECDHRFVYKGIGCKRCLNCGKTIDLPFPLGAEVEHNGRRYYINDYVVKSSAAICIRKSGKGKKPISASELTLVPNEKIRPGQIWEFKNKPDASQFKIVGLTNNQTIAQVKFDHIPITMLFRTAVMDCIARPAGHDCPFKMEKSCGGGDRLGIPFNDHKQVLLCCDGIYKVLQCCKDNLISCRLIPVDEDDLKVDHTYFYCTYDEYDDREVPVKNHSINYYCKYLGDGRYKPVNRKTLNLSRNYWYKVVPKEDM